ncbi:MAG: enoyl-CoA hydratase-related protein [Phycisphaerales bacterium JB059]
MGEQPLPIRFDGQGDQARIATLVLEQGDRPVVVIDKGLVRRLDEAIDRLPEDLDGLVLASGSKKVFVAGADLAEIDRADDQELRDYLEDAARVFRRLTKLPCWTAAAINGAALGGGLELAMHCDGLIGAPMEGDRPYMVGLPEAGLSICPGWGGTNLLPARIESCEGILRAASGKPMTFDEAVKEGLFDVACVVPEELLDAARYWIAEKNAKGRPERDGAPSRWIGRSETAEGVRHGLKRCRGELPGTKAAKAVVECVEIGLTEGWSEAIRGERSRLIQLRHTPEAKEAIARFFAKSARR